MKLITLVFVVAMLGCGCVNIERLNSKLQEGNSTYSLSVPTLCGRVLIHRANPTIGFSATANSNGVSQSSAPNIPISVQYHSLVATPTMPVNPMAVTNQPPTQKPK